jgi:asparagine synthase (glutamine-hydrolysing)
MCGICGIAQSAGRDVSTDALARMTGALAHRGPDGDGLFVDRHIGLGHRRLSIIDLSGGAQPIFNEDESVVIVFNGEIFNYQELTEELIARGHVFKTRSDTEAIVHLYEDFGMSMLDKLRGMFAFALVDRRADVVYLVRDRFGIKPLYYHARAGTLSFASEIRPLTAAGYSMEVNRRAVHQYLMTRFAHGDETIFKGIFRLPEGTYLEWKAGRATERRYYPNPSIAPADPESDDAQFDARFEAEFADAVKTWMVADVPVGAYLSGGVDSSAVVSEMVRLTNHPVRTFCVDFEAGHSEAPAAVATARRLGCEHQTVLCGVEELLALPAVIRTLEEPVGDGIVVAQYFLSRATRQAGIKTVLTGDGADETLGGYQHLRAIAALLTWRKRLPLPGLGRIGSAVARRLPLPIIESLADLALDAARDARTRLASVVAMSSADDMRPLYDELLALYRPADLAEVYTERFYAETAEFPRETLAGDPSGTTLLGQVLSMQYRRWLPANINLKQDRLCMAHGVENRVPFLDHRFVEFMAAAPDREKIAGRCTKVALRRLAARRLPDSVSAAPKMPFHLPLQHMLADRGLWALIEENLDERRLLRRGFIRPSHVATVKRQARAGDFLASKKVLALVILELWHRMFVDGESLASPASA